MKKFFAIILAAMMLITTACGEAPAADMPSPTAAPAAVSPSDAPAPPAAPTSEPASDVAAWVESLDLNTQEEVKVNSINVSFNGAEYTATLADNSSAEAFAQLLRSKGGVLTVAAHDYGNFEKVGELGTTLPRNDRQMTTSAGDIILYLGTNITLYYDTNSWDFTLLGRLDGEIDGAVLRSQLGSGNVDITFSIAE